MLIPSSLRVVGEEKKEEEAKVTQKVFEERMATTVKIEDLPPVNSSHIPKTGTLMRGVIADLRKPTVPYTYDSYFVGNPDNLRQQAVSGIYFPMSPCDFRVRIDLMDVRLKEIRHRTELKKITDFGTMEIHGEEVEVGFLPVTGNVGWDEDYFITFNSPDKLVPLDCNQYNPSDITIAGIRRPGAFSQCAYQTRNGTGAHFASPGRSSNMRGWNRYSEGGVRKVSFTSLQEILR